MLFFSALTKYKAIGVAVVAIFVAIYIGYLNIALGSARGDLKKEQGITAALKMENKVLLETNDDWRLALEKSMDLNAACNQSVADLEKMAENAKKDAQEAIKKASATVALRDEQIKRASARPANPGGSCGASVELAKQDLRG
jgi:hypothetical protein